MTPSEIKRDLPGIYNSWRGMRDRCRSKTRADAKYYSAKGIKICQEWDSVVAFTEWALENGYRPGLTIERVDGSENYSPENCKWADRKEQARNLSKNRILEFSGVKKCLSEWAEATGISSSLILARVTRLGWPVEMALTTPVGVIKTGPKPK